MILRCRRYRKADITAPTRRHNSWLQALAHVRMPMPSRQRVLPNSCHSLCTSRCHFRVRLLLSVRVLLLL